MEEINLLKSFKTQNLVRFSTEPLGLLLLLHAKTQQNVLTPLLPNETKTVIKYFYIKVFQSSFLHLCISLLGVINPNLIM